MLPYKLHPVVYLKVVGQQNSGKTQIINQMINRSFDDNYEKTNDFEIALDLSIAPLEPEEETNYAILQFQDTPGFLDISANEGNKSYVVQNYMKQLEIGEQQESNPIFMKRNPDGWIFVVDATKMKAQLIEIMDFIKELKSIEQKCQIKTVKYLFVNKYDLSQTQINYEREQEIRASDIANIKFVSAKFNQNIRESIRELGSKIRSTMDKSAFNPANVQVKVDDVQKIQTDMKEELLNAGQIQNEKKNEDQNQTSESPSEDEQSEVLTVSNGESKNKIQNNEEQDDSVEEETLFLKLTKQCQTF